MKELNDPPVTIETHLQLMLLNEDKYPIFPTFRILSAYLRTKPSGLSKFA